MLFGPDKPAGTRMGMASLYFHSLQYYETIYTTILLPFQLFLFIYKYNSLAYETRVQAGEIILLIVAFILNMIRHGLGRSGNRAKNVGKIIGYLILTVIIIMGFVYAITWQPYILWLEFIMFLIGILLLGVEFILAIVALIAFKISE